MEFPPIKDYLAGLETRISAHDASKCLIACGRPDALFGNVVLEFERRFPEKLAEAKRQLRKYVGILRKNPGSKDVYFTPIATDGLTFQVFAPREGELRSSKTIGEEVHLEDGEFFDARNRQPTEFYFSALATAATSQP